MPLQTSYFLHLRIDAYFQRYCPLRFSQILTPSHLNTLCLNLVHAVLFLTHFVQCSYIKRWCYLYQLERIRYFPKQRK